MPHQKPIKAGRNAQRPMAEDCSIAGTIRLQTEAATITPAAKPVRERRRASLRLLRRKNTQAEPAAVPRNGIRSPHTDALTFIILYAGSRTLPQRERKALI